MFVHHKHNMETMTCAWFFPVVPGVVTALSAAIVAKVVDVRCATQASISVLGSCHHDSFMLHKIRSCLSSEIMMMYVVGVSESCFMKVLVPLPSHDHRTQR